MEALMAAPELVIPKGVSRFHYGRTRGWLARVYTTAEGERRCTRKLFSDGVHGGELEALDAAARWQEDARLGVPSREKVRVPGYGYVQETVRRYRTQGGELRSYRAFEAWFWDAEERPCSTSWSIETHGAELARRRCEEWLARARARCEQAETGEAELQATG